MIIITPRWIHKYDFVIINDFYEIILGDLIYSYERKMQQSLITAVWASLMKLTQYFYWKGIIICDQITDINLI